MKDFIAIAEISADELQDMLNLTFNSMVDGPYFRLFPLAHNRLHV